jgi:hypothetical protein
VDSTPAAEYARRLCDHGMSAQDIAGAAGVAVTLIRRLLRTTDRRPARISRTTHDAVLGVPLPLQARRRCPQVGRGLTDAALAATLLADLASRGWPASHLATRLRVNPRTIASIRDGRHTRTTIVLVQRVRRLHRELADATPVSAGVRAADASRTRAWAARRTHSVPSPRLARVTAPDRDLAA